MLRTTITNHNHNHICEMMGMIALWGREWGGMGWGLESTGATLLGWRITADRIVQTEITQISDVECQTSSERGCEPTSKFKTHLIDVNLMFVVSNVNCSTIFRLIYTV